MDLSFIGNQFDIGIIIGIILISQVVKERLHNGTKMSNDKIDYHIMPFIPLLLGVFAGISVVFRDANIEHNFWNIFWQAVKYSGASSFLYHLWSRFGKRAIEKIIVRKIEKL